MLCCLSCFIPHEASALLLRQAQIKTRSRLKPTSPLVNLKHQLQRKSNQWANHSKVDSGQPAHRNNNCQFDEIQPGIVENTTVYTNCVPIFLYCSLSFKWSIFETYKFRPRVRCQLKKHAMSILSAVKLPGSPWKTCFVQEVVHCGNSLEDLFVRVCFQGLCEKLVVHYRNSLVDLFPDMGPQDLIQSTISYISSGAGGATASPRTTKFSNSSGAAAWT